jgi:hypothetical protein
MEYSLRNALNKKKRATANVKSTITANILLVVYYKGSWVIRRTKCSRMLMRRASCICPCSISIIIAYATISPLILVIQTQSRLRARVCVWSWNCLLQYELHTSHFSQGWTKEAVTGKAKEHKGNGTFFPFDVFNYIGHYFFHHTRRVSAHVYWPACTPPRQTE